MSNVLTTLCRPLRMSATQKAVLMCLADHANNDGLAWPSIPGICEWTCLSRTAVIDAMHWLEEQRFVTIEKATGKNNRCALSVDKISMQQPVSQLGLNQSATRTRSPDAPVRQTDHTSTPDVPPPVREADYTRPPDAPEASISTNQASEKQAEGIQMAVKTKKPKTEKNLSVIPDDILPGWIPLDAWKSYLEMRQSIKSPMTVNAQKLLVAKLGRLRESEHDLRELLEQATISNWRSVYAPQGAPGGQRHRSGGAAYELRADEQLRATT